MVNTRCGKGRFWAMPRPITNRSERKWGALSAGIGRRGPCHSRASFAGFALRFVLAGALMGARHMSRNGANP
jgi:hypothetical protein